VFSESARQVLGNYDIIRSRNRWFAAQSSPITGIPFRYTGRYLDAETGLYYYRARYYSTKLGRFLQTDPIGTKDDLNLYAYAGNDPIDGADATGNCNDPHKVGCTTTGIPQNTGGANGATHAQNSVDNMKEMVADAKAAGETGLKGSFNQSQTNATNGQIVSNQRTDATLTSTSKDGASVIRNGEITSPSQTMLSQEAKLVGLAEKASTGTKVLGYLGDFGKAVSKKLGILGAVLIARDVKAGIQRGDSAKQIVKDASGFGFLDVPTPPGADQNDLPD